MVCIALVFFFKESRNILFIFGHFLILKTLNLKEQNYKILKNSKNGSSRIENNLSCIQPS